MRGKRRRRMKRKRKRKREREKERKRERKETIRLFLILNALHSAIKILSLLVW